MSETLLSVRGLSVSYGRIAALTNVSIDIDKGTIVTVIGTNGAGKSSMLNAIMGLLPSSGSVTFAGNDIGKLSVEERAMQELSLVPERRELFGSMTVEDNLLLGGHLIPSRQDLKARMEANYERFPKLRQRRQQRASTLSGGERQMLAMARALMMRPRLLMLDEPSLGLAPLIVRDVFQIIEQLRGEGISILLVEQNARAALRIADHAYVIELGAITNSSPAKDLVDDPRIVEMYLGGAGGSAGSNARAAP